MVSVFTVNPLECGNFNTHAEMVHKWFVCESPFCTDMTLTLYLTVMFVDCCISLNLHTQTTGALRARHRTDNSFALDFVATETTIWDYLDCCLMLCGL